MVSHIIDHCNPLHSLTWDILESKGLSSHPLWLFCWFAWREYLWNFGWNYEFFIANFKPECCLEKWAPVEEFYFLLQLSDGVVVVPGIVLCCIEVGVPGMALDKCHLRQRDFCDQHLWYLWSSVSFGYYHWHWIFIFQLNSVCEGEETDHPSLSSHWTFIL